MYDLPFRLLLCLGFATTPSCTVCVFKVAFLLGPAACLVVFLVFKVGGGAESTIGDRVRKCVGDGKLRSTSIRRGTASRQEVEKSSPFYSRNCNGVLRERGNEILSGFPEQLATSDFGARKVNSGCLSRFLLQYVRVCVRLVGS
jgi:hypothetical protein